ncbi:MAG: hypothetical protein SNJ29_14250 [Rikenellaceae bacterium]
MINTTPNPEHRYKKRSCLICDSFLDKSCHAYDEHQQPIMFCDKAKYGCKLFTCNDLVVMSERKNKYQK